MIEGCLCYDSLHELSRNVVACLQNSVRTFLGGKVLQTIMIGAVRQGNARCNAGSVE